MQAKILEQNKWPYKIKSAVNILATQTIITIMHLDFQMELTTQEYILSSKQNIMDLRVIVQRF